MIFFYLRDTWYKTNFIEPFREKRILWDPTLMNLKIEGKNWTELHQELETDPSEVEKSVCLSSSFSGTRRS